jgi:DNA-binding transcriptional ArsR family regulator
VGLYVIIQEVPASSSTFILAYNCRQARGVVEVEEAPSVQDLFPPLKALADETRLQILALLEGRELYAQEIVERLDISQPAVSRHLKLMVVADVLRVRQEDNMKYYSVNEEVLAAIAERLRSFRGYVSS